MQRPGLADERHDRREAVDESGEARVLGGLAVTAAGHPERRDRRLLERNRREQLEQLEVLRVRVREARLDEVDTEAIERLDHTDLLGRRQRQALSLHAVAQSRVVNLNLAQGDRTYFLTDDRLRVGPGVDRYDAAPMLSCSPAGAQASAGR